MNRLERWAACLLLWHLLVVVVFFRCWGGSNPYPHWMGSVLVFSLFTVQFTWSFTVALIVGPERRRRKRYWGVLWLSFIPLNFIYMICMLAYRFISGKAALICLGVSLIVLLAETIAGILCGNGLRARLRGD
jgi:hypothetical protein